MSVGSLAYFSLERTRDLSSWTQHVLGAVGRGAGCPRVQSGDAALWSGQQASGPGFLNRVTSGKWLPLCAPASSSIKQVKDGRRVLGGNVINK